MNQPADLVDLTVEHDVIAGLLHGVGHGDCGCNPPHSAVLHGAATVLEPIDFASETNRLAFTILRQHILSGGGPELLTGTADRALEHLISNPKIETTLRTRLQSQALAEDDCPLVERLIEYDLPLHRVRAWMNEVRFAGSCSLVPQQAERLKELRGLREQWSATIQAQTTIIERARA